LNFDVDVLVDRVKMLKNWRIWVGKVAEVVGTLLPGARVYVIGSVVRGDYVAGSDVDVLIVSEHVPDRLVERSRLKVAIEDGLKLPYYHPFEFHLVKPEEAEIYLRRAGEDILEV